MRDVDGRQVLVLGRDPICQSSGLLDGHERIDEDSVAPPVDEGRRHRLEIRLSYTLQAARLERWVCRGVTNTSHFKGSACESCESSLTVTMLTTLRNSRIRLKDEKAANPAIALYALWLGYSAPAMHRVGLVVAGDFQIMSCAAVAAFDVANIFAGKTFYKVRVISERGGVVRSSVGVAIETARLSGAYDTLLVAGPTAIAPVQQGRPGISAARSCTSRVAWRPSAQVRSFWPRLESSMAGEPQHIGCLPASCRPDIQKCAWKKTAFSRTMVLSGRRRG